MVCPICDTKSNNSQSCLSCGWEFVYFSEEPTSKQLVEYNEMMYLYAKEITSILVQNNEPFEFFALKALSFKNDIDIYSLLIDLYIQNNQYDTALNFALECLELMPCATAYACVSLSYLHLDQYTVALDYAKKTIQSDPTYPMDSVFGDIYRCLNQPILAIQYYNKYLKLNPNDNNTKEYVNNMQIQLDSVNKIQENKSPTIQQNTPPSKENPVKNKEVVIKLTSSMLQKNQFETNKEYEDRIRDLGEVEIGNVSLWGYKTDTELFNTKCEIHYNLGITSSLLQYATNVKIPRNDAKNIYERSPTQKLIAKLKIINGKYEIIDLSVCGYSFFELAKDRKAQKEEEVRKQKEKEENDTRDLNTKIINNTYYLYYAGKLSYEQSLEALKELNRINHKGQSNWALIDRKMCETVFNTPIIFHVNSVVVPEGRTRHPYYQQVAKNELCDTHFFTYLRPEFDPRIKKSSFFGIFG